MHAKLLALVAVLVLVTPSCSIVAVDSKDGPPRIEANGLIGGHAAIGISSEKHLLHLNLFDGQSSGAIGELIIWKLLRLEVGLAGASITVGPLHLGLGTLFYDPVVPSTMDFDDEEEYEDHDESDEETSEESDDHDHRP